MNLLVVGDHHPNSDHEAFRTVADLLDQIHKVEPIQKIITFSEPGVADDATIWAHEIDVPWTMFTTAKVSNELIAENKFLRRVVDDYEVTAILFVLFPGTTTSTHSTNVRWFKQRALKAFKQQKIFIYKP